MNSAILIVDDMPIFRDPIAASLRMGGYQTKSASNGAEALDLVRQETPALILLDMSMPVMDGLSFLRALRAEPAIASVPVILMTALSDRDRMLEAVKLGIEDYLLKSRFSLKELLARVNKCLPLPTREGA